MDNNQEKEIKLFIAEELRNIFSEISKSIQNDPKTNQELKDVSHNIFHSHIFPSLARRMEKINID